MGRKKKSDVNVSAEIRKYYDAHKSATHQEIADALKKKKIDVTANYVGNIIRAHKGKKSSKKTTGKRGRPKGSTNKKTSARKTAGKSKAEYLDQIVAANELLKLCGGVEAATKAIQEADELKKRLD